MTNEMEALRQIRQLDGTRAHPIFSSSVFLNDREYAPLATCGIWVLRFGRNGVQYHIDLHEIELPGDCVSECLDRSQSLPCSWFPGNRNGPSALELTR